MSGLFTTLNSSVKALNAHSRAIETAGRNLANVNNTAYARQRVVYGDRGTVVTPGGVQSLGIEALGLQQLRDGLLDRQVMRELGLQSAYTAEQAAYQRAQAGLGQNIDRSGAASAAGASSGAGGLGAALDDFFNAFQSLASRPTDTGERHALLQKSQILVDRFQQADARLGQVQADLDSQIAGNVSDLNTLLANIADLNSQIGRVEIGRPGSAVDLRDQRQARLEELAALVPIETRPGTDGQVNVVMRDAANADVVLVDHATVTGPVAFTGTGLTGGASATVLVFSSGAVAGALAARDGAVQALRTDLDNLARQLVTSVNAAYNPGATVGADYFNAAGLTAGGISLTAGLTAAGIRAGSAAAGDNSLALAVAGVANQVFATAGGDAIDGTLSQHFAGAVSRLGQALAGVNARLSGQDSITQLVKAQRDGVSGVSLDEEMADLVRFQRAFQASSRVFSIVDELLDTVVNRLGR
jgi:flagellar hook-associated protein 1 FlgK